MLNLNFNFINKIKRKIFPFYKNNDLKFVFNCLQQDFSNNTIAAMYVGGCVRKFLLNENVDDIDIATILTPEQIIAKFKNTKFKVIESGIKHGTVTLVLNKLKLELTTLRRDIKSYGRHADVVFTEDWLEDSKRRDISINAIYLDRKGKLYDPQNGVKDLKNKIVRFIGDPDERIQEDYLRIIRFLRFAIQYDSSTDEGTILALKLNLDGIKSLSKERILDELIKILKLDNLDFILKHQNKRLIFSLIFPELKNIDKISKLKHFKEKKEPLIQEDLILAILLFDKTNNFEYFCHKYKVSNKLSKNLSLLFENFNSSKSDSNFFKKNLLKNIYHFGIIEIKKIAILNFFDKLKMTIEELYEVLNKIDNVTIPILSYDGNYLIEKGLSEGDTIGKTLKVIEQEWINNNFKISDQKVLEIVSKHRN